MKLQWRLAVYTLAAAAVLGGSTAALGDSPASDAAAACLQGPQIDYYQVVNASDSGPPLDFGDLQHGSDSTGPFVIAMSNGDCVSFVAKNSKGKGSTSNPKPTPYIKYTFETLIITG